MTDINNLYYVHNCGFITKKFTNDELLPIINEINEIKLNFNNATPYNEYLAGNLKHEYLLLNSFNYAETLISPLIHEFNKHFPTVFESEFDLFKKGTELKFKLETLWVNFMKKYEFNPMHTHTGVYSFVLWIDIPYDIKDEMSRESSIKSNTNCPGHFEFFYTNSFGKIEAHSIPADKSFNSVLVFFPAKLNHCVHPFYTSDEYRISVSGNFVFDI
jgi:hypothetical protein